MRLIDADALKELFPDNGEGSWTYNITSKMYIDNAPTVFTQEDIDNVLELAYISGQQHPERPKGKWIAIHKGYVCSNCNKYTITINDKHYCFKCGAYMRGDV